MKKSNDENWNHSCDVWGKLYALDSCFILLPFYGPPIKRSFDQGTSWESVDLLGVHDLAVAENILFAHNGVNQMIYRSDDFGDTFELISEELSPCEFDELFADDSLLFILDRYECERIFTSINLGETWDSLSYDGLSPSVYDYYQCFEVFNNKLWLGTNDGVFCYNDELHYWFGCNTGLPNEETILDFVEFNNELYCAGDFGLYIWESTLNEWEAVNTENSIYQLCIFNNLIYAAGDMGVYYFDTIGNCEFDNEGINSRSISSIDYFDEKIYVCAEQEVFYSDDQGFEFEKTGWVGKQIITTDSMFYLVDDDNVYSSVDQGENWNSLADYLDVFIARLSITSKYCFITTNDGYYRKHHDSTNWIKPNSNIQNFPFWYIESIDSVVMATTNENAYFSKDYGMSFDTLFSGVIRNLFKVDTGLYVLFDNYTLYSLDLGQTWDTINHPENSNEIHYDQFDISGKNCLLGGAYFIPSMFHVQISYDLGRQWEYISYDLPLPPGFSSIGIVKFVDNDVFVNPNKTGLWFKEDLITHESKVFPLAHKGIKIYPNPFADIIHLEVDFNIDESSTYFVYDIHGKVLKRGDLASTRINIALNKLNPGLYLLKIITDNESLVVKILKK